jgi:hypothetical protein
MSAYRHVALRGDRFHWLSQFSRRRRGAAVEGRSRDTPEIPSLGPPRTSMCSDRLGNDPRRPRLAGYVPPRRRTLLLRRIARRVAAAAQLASRCVQPSAGKRAAEPREAKWRAAEPLAAAEDASRSSGGAMSVVKGRRARRSALAESRRAADVQACAGDRPSTGMCEASPRDGISGVSPEHVCTAAARRRLTIGTAAHVSTAMRPGTGEPPING